MATTGEPLSDARLAEWRADALDARRVLNGSITIPQHRLEEIVWDYAERYAARMIDALAEVERLRAREAALLAIAERVAEAGVGDDYSGGTWLMFSGYDAETVRYQARVLLASTGETVARPAAPGRE